MSDSYSSDVNISIQRDDDDAWIETISINRYKFVSDLLEKSRSSLKFEKHDRLSAHKIYGERIDDLYRIDDIAHLGTIVIKHTGTRANYEDAASHLKYGLASLQVGQDGNSNKTRHRCDLSKLEARRRDDEIWHLNLELEIRSDLKVKGFLFTIDPEDYTDYCKGTERICHVLFNKFFSEKEYAEKQSKIRAIPSWSNWKPLKALPCWGIRINNNIDKDNPPKQSHGNTNRETSEILTVIVRKTYFYPVKEFRVNVTINEKAVKKAKKVLKMSTKEEKQNKVKKFNDKYCSFVYSGKFYAGAWLAIVAKASGQDLTSLEKCATERIEQYWSQEFLGYPSSSYLSAKYKDTNVKVSTVSDPLCIWNMHELQRTLTNVQTGTIFPGNWDEKSHFIPVYKIMQNQAEADNDEDLRKVSAIFKECMEEVSHSDVVTDMEVDDHFTEMEIQRREGPGNNLFSTRSSHFQNAEGQSWRKRDARFPFRSNYRSRKTESNKKLISPTMTMHGGASLPLLSNYRSMKTKSESTLDKKLERIPAKMIAHDKRMMCTSSVPYVVFVGDAGTGKSTIVEKLTGEKDRSSNESESFTRSSGAFRVPDGSLIVADTPGGNSRKDRAEHNIWIAGALNFQPVSRIFIVTKAQPRIDSVIDNVCKYTDNFVELPFDVLGVVATHMDLVEWEEENLISAIDDEIGIDAVIFSNLTTTAETLLPKILETCTGTHDLTVNHANFAKLFKIPNNHRKILKFINDEVKKFSMMKEAFDRKRKMFFLDQNDLAFEFLTYMSDKIADAKDRMTEYNNFTFKGDSAALEAGHVLNMVNQLNTVLFDIRKECFTYQCEHGVSEFRKCPYCGLVWTKKESCSGNTICGNSDSPVSHTRDGKWAIFCTFAFAWEGDELNIQKKREQDVNYRYSRPTFGCGKTINWKDMAPAQLSSELSRTIQLCSRRIKVDSSRESRFGKVGEIINFFNGLTRR